VIPTRSGAGIEQELRLSLQLEALAGFDMFRRQLDAGHDRNRCFDGPPPVREKVGVRGSSMRIATALQ
jgi:hypothetical protein